MKIQKKMMKPEIMAPMRLFGNMLYGVIMSLIVAIFVKKEGNPLNRLILKSNKSDLMDLSVVVPVYNEEESLAELAGWIEKVCIANKLEFEIIFIDDGSSDSSWDVITELSKEKQFS